MHVELLKIEILAKKKNKKLLKIEMMKTRNSMTSYRIYI